MFRASARHKQCHEQRRAAHRGTGRGYPCCEDCPSGAFPLSGAACDQCVRLVCVEGGHRLRRRLAELGLNPGSELRVLQSHGGGPMILAVKGDARMAIGRGMAHKILVEAVAPGGETD